MTAAKTVAIIAGSAAAFTRTRHTIRALDLDEAEGGRSPRQYAGIRRTRGPDCNGRERWEPGSRAEDRAVLSTDGKYPAGAAVRRPWRWFLGDPVPPEPFRQA